MGLVVEDHAVLQHLHHAGAVVLGGAGHDVGGELRQAVQRTGIESALRAHHQLTRVERVVDGAVRRGLGDLTELRGRAVLTFGEAVDFVVEDGDVEVLVTAHRMDEVVAADGHGVAVAHAHPHGESRVGQLHARGDGAGTPVDAVETVRVHIVRNT